MSHPNFGGTYTPPAKKRSKAWIWVLAVAAAFLFCLTGIVAMAATNAGGKPAPAPAVTVTVTRTVTASPAASTAAPTEPAATTVAPVPVKTTAAPVTIDAGTWEVGSEVKAGTYTATAIEHCYWARLSGFDGTLGQIIANDNLDPGQRGRITIKKSDAGIELDGDCTWKRVK